MKSRPQVSRQNVLVIQHQILGAIQTRLDPSSLLEERSETPFVFVVSFVLSATPQTGRNGQGIKIDR